MKIMPAYLQPDQQIEPSDMELLGFKKLLLDTAVVADLISKPARRHLVRVRRQGIELVDIIGFLNRLASVAAADFSAR